MALNLVLSENHKAPIWREQTSIVFEDEGADYWFLYGSMIEEIKQHTGEVLDLYDDAHFSGQKLAQLNRIVLKTVAKIQTVPEQEWQVHLGTQTQPEHKELYRTLTKKYLLQKLNKFAFMIDLAMKKGEMIIGIGD